MALLNELAHIKYGETERENNKNEISVPFYFLSSFTLKGWKQRLRRFRSFDLHMQGGGGK